MVEGADIKGGLIGPYFVYECVVKLYCVSCSDGELIYVVYI